MANAEGCLHLPIVVVGQGQIVDLVAQLRRQGLEPKRLIGRLVRHFVMGSCSGEEFALCMEQGCYYGGRLEAAQSLARAERTAYPHFHMRTNFPQDTPKADVGHPIASSLHQAQRRLHRRSPSWRRIEMA